MRAACCGLAWIATVGLVAPISVGCTQRSVPLGSDSSGTDASPGAADSTDASVAAVPVARVGGSDVGGAGWLDWSGPPHPADVITGIQGTEHIWVSVRVRNLNPKKLHVAATLVIEGPGGDELVKPGRIEATLKFKPDGADLLYEGLPAFVSEPCKINGKRVRVEVEVTDVFGQRARDTAWIIPVYTRPCGQAP